MCWRRSKITQINEENKNKIINKIYSASLDFGNNWMRPIHELAKELYPALPQHEIIERSAYLYQVREDIFKCVLNLYLLCDGDLAQKAKDYIKSKYDWMNEENIIRSINQGQYYAWHG
jgi:hypothetical protein